MRSEKEHRRVSLVSSVLKFGWVINHLAHCIRPGVGRADTHGHPQADRNLRYFFLQL